MLNMDTKKRKTEKLKTENGMRNKKCKMRKRRNKSNEKKRKTRDDIS